MPKLSGSTRANSQIPVQVTLNPSDAEVQNSSGATVPAKSLLVVFTAIGQANRALLLPCQVERASLIPAGSTVTAFPSSCPSAGSRLAVAPSTTTRSA